MRRNYILIALCSVVLLAMVGCKGNSNAKQEAQVQKADSVQTNMLTDFRMKSIDGVELSLKEEVSKHRITIIDFWATWCGPCMREVPNLVSLYNDYKDKGLGIVGVSLDEDEAAWKTTVKEQGMSWTHLSDLQGWDNAAARLYNVQGIPYIIVADNKGHILAQDLRGEDLRAFIEEQLK